MDQPTALLVSLAIEVPVVLLATRRLAEPRPTAVAWTQAALAATMMTHPVAWWLNSAGLTMLAPMLRLLCIEAAVAVAEGALYGWLCRRPLMGLGVSLVANGASFGIGLLWFRYVG